MRRAFVVALGLGVIAPPAAVADGLPVMGTYGSSGVTGHDGAYRYVTFPSGRNTLVARLHVDGGEVARYRSVPGRFMVPLVAYDNSASGLSTDDKALVLIRPRPALAQKFSELAVLDARRLTMEKRIKLRGDFSFDALSPDGSTAYLIEYRSLTRRSFDVTDYRVRALDTRTGKLDPQPIVDPREPDEQMGGLPVARTMSPDARWAYTLYSGEEHPFIHALDTTGRTARCIDLDALTGREDLFELRLRTVADGRQLQVVKENMPVQVVDTRTFVVSEPRAPAKPKPQHAAKPIDDGDGTPAWPWAAAVGVLVLVALASARPLAKAARAR